MEIRKDIYFALIILLYCVCNLLMLHRIVQQCLKISLHFKVFIALLGMLSHWLELFIN